MSFREFLKETMVSNERRVGKLKIITTVNKSGNQSYTIHDLDDNLIEDKKFISFVKAAQRAKEIQEETK